MPQVSPAAPAAAPRSWSRRHTFSHESQHVETLPPPPVAAPKGRSRSMLLDMGGLPSFLLVGSGGSVALMGCASGGGGGGSGGCGAGGWDLPGSGPNTPKVIRSSMPGGGGGGCESKGWSSGSGLSFSVKPKGGMGRGGDSHGAGGVWDMGGSGARVSKPRSKSCMQPQPLLLSPCPHPHAVMGPSSHVASPRAVAPHPLPLSSHVSSCQLHAIPPALLSPYTPSSSAPPPHARSPRSLSLLVRSPVPHPPPVGMLASGRTPHVCPAPAATAADAGRRVSTDMLEGEQSLCVNIGWHQHMRDSTCFLHA
jgi:hypothetical protein